MKNWITHERKLARALITLVNFLENGCKFCSHNCWDSLQNANVHTYCYGSWTPPQQLQMTCAEEQGGIKLFRSLAW